VIGTAGADRSGPGLPTCATKQVGSYLGYTDRDAEALATGAPDPQQTPRALANRQGVVARLLVVPQFTFRSMPERTCWQSEPGPVNSRMSPLVSPTVETKVTGLLGWEPISWTKIEGGYTPAARFVVRNGHRSAFVKLATTAVTAAHMHREIAVYAALAGPFRPRFYGADNDAKYPFLIIEDLSKATWPPPWSDAYVCAVIQAMAELHSATATLRTYLEVHGSREPCWQAVAREPTPFLKLGLATEDWLSRSLPSLIAAEGACPTGGDAVTHWDVRSDNICFLDGRAIFVDWGEACLSNPKLDLGFWLPSLAHEGGPKPEAILPGEPEIAAWVSGFFAATAGLAPVPDAPFVRRVQQEQLAASLPWVCSALGLGDALA
jgi:aminoglycoside phosphotransferase (APT) family kinase protein